MERAYHLIPGDMNWNLYWELDKCRKGCLAKCLSADSKTAQVRILQKDFEDWIGSWDFSSLRVDGFIVLGYIWT